MRELTLSDVEVGQKIRFGRRSWHSEQTKAVIVKKNRVKLLVEILENRGKHAIGDKFRVPLSLVKRVCITDEVGTERWLDTADFLTNRRDEERIATMVDLCVRPLSDHGLDKSKCWDLILVPEPLEETGVFHEPLCVCRPVLRGLIGGETTPAELLILGDIGEDVGEFFKRVQRHRLDPELLKHPELCMDNTVNPGSLLYNLRLGGDEDISDKGLTREVIQDLHTKEMQKNNGGKYKDVNFLDIFSELDSSTIKI